MRFVASAFLFGPLLAVSMGVAVERRVRVGDSFPHFKLPHLYSKKKAFDGTQLKGNVAVIDFWGSDCPPCREAVPELNNLYKEFQKKSVVVLGINVDENEKDTKSFLAEFKPLYPLLDDGKHKFVPVMGIESMPTTYVIDRTGKVRFINKGFKSGDIEKIREAILKALSNAK